MPAMTTISAGVLPPMAVICGRPYLWLGRHQEKLHLILSSSMLQNMVRSVFLLLLQAGWSRGKGRDILFLPKEILIRLYPLWLVAVAMNDPLVKCRLNICKNLPPLIICCFFFNVFYLSSFASGFTYVNACNINCKKIEWKIPVVVINSNAKPNNLSRETNALFCAYDWYKIFFISNHHIFMFDFFFYFCPN